MVRKRHAQREASIKFNKTESRDWYKVTMLKGKEA